MESPIADSEEYPNLDETEFKLHPLASKTGGVNSTDKEGIIA